MLRMQPNTPPNPPIATSLEEAQSIINELWQCVMAQAKAIEKLEAKIQTLEEKLNTNSRNSSKPPSTDSGLPAKDASGKKGKKKKQGGQPGHVGKGRALLSEIDEAHDCYPEKACACGGEINIMCLQGRHQTIDIPVVKPTVTEYRVYAGVCQGCGKHHAGSLPIGASNRLVGPRLLGLIGTLTGGYRLSKRLVQGLLRDLFQIDLSVGTISESEEIISAALKPVAEEAHTHVKQAPVVHGDETPHKEKGQRQWMWVAIAGCVSVFLARANRSAESAKELLGAAFAGILVSDRYSAYSWVAAACRQVCWAHLLRDFTKISERSGAAGQIGERLLMHTQRCFRYWHRVRDGTLPQEKFVKLMAHMRVEIEATLHRGVDCGDTKTANTCKAILKLKAALWTFVDTQNVEPTNNLAERTIRSYVIWRKTSFGTQSTRGSVYAERVMTVVGTCKLQGRNILEFMTCAVRAHLTRTAPPSLLPARIG